MPEYLTPPPGYVEQMSRHDSSREHTGGQKNFNRAVLIVAGTVAFAAFTQTPFFERTIDSVVQGAQENMQKSVQDIHSRIQAMQYCPSFPCYDPKQ